MRRLRLLTVLAMLAGLAGPAIGACSSSSSDGEAGSPSADASTGSDASGTTADASSGSDATSGDPGCPRTASTSDRVRKVVISHPTDADAGKAKDYEVLELALDGTLSRTGPRFSMGRNFDAPIVFSPDGTVGVVVQDDDGSLGIFRFDGTGAPVVVAEAFGKEHFYATWAVFSPDGSRLYVADDDRNPQGGVHEVAIACDGTPTYRGQVLAAPGAGSLTFVPGGSKAVTIAASAPNAAKGNDAFLVDFVPGAATVTSSDKLFGDDELDPHGVGITPDGKLALVPDGNDAFGTNRLGVLSLATGLKNVAVLTLESPSGIAMSPWGNAAIVTAAGGPSVDAIHAVKIDSSNGAAPVTVTGKLAATPKPQLPTGPVVIQTGALKGLVIVSEVEGLRRVQFDANGSVKDLGLFSLGGGLEASPGSVGVQP